MSLIEALQKSTLTTGMNRAEIEALANIGETRNYYKGETLFNEGDPCESVFILVEGKVNIEGHLVANRHNIPKQIQTVKHGQVFGEMAYIENGLRSATARAKSNVEVIVLDAGKLKELMQENSELGLKLMQNIALILSRRLRRMNDQWLSAIGRDVILPEFEYY